MQDEKSIIPKKYEVSQILSLEYQFVYMQLQRRFIKQDETFV
jgi:hypothetical protein